MNVINVGNSPDDNNGDPLRNAFIKINANFVELLAAVSGELGATVTLNFAEMVAIQAADVINRLASVEIAAEPASLIAALPVYANNAAALRGLMDIGPYTYVEA